MAQVSFGSDNHSGVHPQIMQALVDGNEGHVPSYGTDELSLRAQKAIQSQFGPGSRSYFVFNGTASNVLALQAVTKPHQSIICSSVSHLNVDECGAPERHLGSKLIAIPSPDGKISPSDIEPFLIRGGDQHFSQPKVVSITQPTEYGVVYSLKEIEAISKFCKSRGLFLHIDGARLIHAATRLNCSLAEVVRGADVVSFGGTKNGLMFGEAVVFLTPGLDEDFKYSRKQMLQLPSKTRFVGAQFLKLLENDLWKEISQHCLAMAQYLSEQLQAFSEIKITQAVQANAVFALFPKSIVGPLREKFFFYVWNEKTFEVRLMTSFDTKKTDIDSFVSELRSALGK